MSLLRTAGRAAVASSVHGRVQRKQAQKFAAQDQARAAQASAPPVQFVQQMPTPVVAPVVSPVPAPVVAAPPVEAEARLTPPSIDPERRIALLKELAELRSMGVLTDPEFEAEKAKILG